MVVDEFGIHSGHIQLPEILAAIDVDIDPLYGRDQAGPLWLVFEHPQRTSQQPIDQPGSLGPRGRDLRGEPLGLLLPSQR
nr:hypothetical protein [Natronosporangium hydrolyticum]